ncbi:4116_t:CDS:1, partial [Acaulospora colombiana]
NASNEGVSQTRVRIMQNLKPVSRPPLESLRIVHATDVEFRHMCRIPTKKLIVYDPLDQLLLGELLSQKECFPFMTTFELQYVLEGGEENAALDSIKNAIALRGDCTFLDTRDKHPPPRRGFW